jgi:hypothetical protein
MHGQASGDEYTPQHSKIRYNNLASLQLGLLTTVSYKLNTIRKVSALSSKAVHTLLALSCL